VSESVESAVEPKSKGSVLKKVAGVFAVLGVLKLASLVTSHISTAYADATARQNARDGGSVALVHAKDAAQVVEVYFKKHSSFPVSLTAAEFDKPLPEPVQSIRISMDGVLRVVLMGKGRSELRSFRFQPKIDSTGAFSWTCQLDDMPPNVLPDECARSNGV
jgi:hypothetical protein